MYLEKGKWVNKEVLSLLSVDSAQSARRNSNPIHTMATIAIFSPGIQNYVAICMNSKTEAIEIVAKMRVDLKHSILPTTEGGYYKNQVPIFPYRILISQIPR